MMSSVMDCREGESYPIGVLLGRALAEARIPRCFGIPGVQNLRIYEALEQGAVEPVLVANELSAVYLAAGQYQSSGQVGCANLIGGPGLTHAMPGIEFAYRNNIPVFIIVTGAARDEGRSYQLHDVNNLAIVAPICKETHRLTSNDDVMAIVARMIAHALDGTPGPCVLEVPMDVLKHHAIFHECARNESIASNSNAAFKLPPEAPECLARALDACAAAVGRSDVHVIRDGGIHQAPWTRSAIPIALGAAFSSKLAVAITDLDTFIAFAPELALAIQRRMALVLFVKSEAERIGDLEAAARLVGIPILRAPTPEQLGEALVAAMQIPQAVLCDADLMESPVKRSTPMMVSPKWLSAVADGARGNGAVFMAEDGSLAPLLEAFAASGIAVTSVRHDQNLGFMVDGASRTSKRPGLLIIHESWAYSSALSGVGEAFLDQIPLVVLVVSSTSTPAFVRTFEHLTKNVAVIDSLVAATIKDACKLAASSAPGPVCLVCPMDRSETAQEGSEIQSLRVEHEAGPLMPPDALLDDVANMFFRAKQPLLFVGRGAKEAVSELRELADLTGSLVASTLSGKGVYAETDPHWLWAGFGPLCPPPMKTIAETCDGALIVGARLSELGSAHYRARFPKYCFHLDIDPDVPNKMTSAIPITADAKSFLGALVEHIKKYRKSEFPRHSSIVARDLVAAHAWVREDVRNRPIEDELDPYALLQTVQRLLPADTIFCSDSGNGTIHAIEALRLSQPDRFLCPADYNSMGYSVPAAIGAALSNPKTTVVSIVGDGAFLMTGVKSLLGEPQAPPIIVIVLRDRRLGMIGDIQKFTNRGEVCTLLPDVHFDSSKHREFLYFETVSDLEALEKSIEQAKRELERGKTSVLECIVDPEKKSYFFKGAFSSPMQPPAHTAPFVPEYRSDLPEDLWAILERAREQFPDCVAIKDGETHHTYEELYNRSMRLAQFFHDQGIQAGDVVGVMLRNCSEVIEAHFALAALRAVVLNVNVRLAAPELNYIFNTSHTRWLIATTDFANTLSAVADIGEISLDGMVWVERASAGELENGDERLGDHRFYREIMAEPVTSFQPRIGSGSDPAHLYYTSGTTGFPKGVLLNHRQVFIHALATAEEMRITHDDVWGHFSAMYHVVDAFAIYALTWFGGRHVIVSDPDPTSFLRLLAQERITCTNLAAAAAHFLIHSPDVEHHDYSALRIVSCGGSALDANTIKRLLDILGCEIFMSYGMTECCGKISMSLLSEEHQKSSAEERLALIATSGRPFKRMQVRIVDENGVDVAADNRTIGEVWIRGVTVFNGYFNDANATQDAFQDGWFKTGDLATIRPDQYLTIVGRKKDMIITYGENVYAGEVERVLCLHPGVQQAAVYGLEHPSAGEIVKAVVRLETSQSLTSAELTAFCRQHLAGYKVPAIVEFIDEMPMSGTFKIDKLLLKSKEAGVRAPGPMANTAAAPHRAARDRAELDLPACTAIVIKLIGTIAGTNTVNLPTDVTLWNLGLDSILFLTLFRQLEREFEIVLDPNFLVHNNTIAKIANSVVTMVAAARSKTTPNVSSTTLIDESVLNSWQATVTRPLGGFEAVVFQSNRNGHLHVNPVLEIEGHIEPEIMQEAAALLVRRFPYLAATMCEKNGGFFLEYDPSKRIEIVFLLEHEASPLHETLATHMRDAASKKILFIRKSSSREVYDVAPAIWHCHLEVQSFIRMIQELLEIYERLQTRTTVDPTARPLPVSREDLFAKLRSSGVAPITPDPEEILAKTGQEVTPVIELFRVNKFQKPFGDRKRPRGICLEGEYRSFAWSGERTRSLLNVGARERSSLTGILSAALSLVARDLVCSKGKTHRLLLVGSFDVRPLLNLPADALGYYATYPKFIVNVEPKTEFWNLARHFHEVNQHYIDNRTYAGTCPDYYRNIARGYGSISRMFWIPGVWNQFTAPGRLFAVNLGVLESRMGGFVVRGMKVLQDIPSLTIYSYVLNGRLHVQTCSQLPRKAADQFADLVERTIEHQVSSTNAIT